MLVVFCISLYAKGPTSIVKSDRSLLIYPIKTPQDFDFASQMENLAFAVKLNNLEFTDNTKYTNIHKKYKNKIISNLSNIKKNMQRYATNSTQDSMISEAKTHFNDTTSEILRFSKNEINSCSMDDKYFTVTFDDSPTKRRIIEKFIELLDKTQILVIFLY